MGVIIKYQVNFPDLKISNDALKGDFIVDADVRVDMSRGATGSGFKISLYDLPKARADQLDQAPKDKKRVQISLGYFDEPFAKVIDGIYDTVETRVEADKLVTTVKGVESATHALVTTMFKADAKNAQFAAGNVAIPEIVKRLLGQPNLPGDEIDRGPVFDQAISKKLMDFAPRDGLTFMALLEDLASRAEAELLVTDKRVRLGSPITDDSRPPVELDPDVNLAVFRPFSREIPDERNPNILKPLPAAQVQGFKFTITGDPTLRPGHTVVPKVKDFDPSSGAEFRIYCLTHHLSVAAGYVCEGFATRRRVESNIARQVDAACERSAAAVARILAQRVQDEQRRRPPVEIGKVKTYTPQTHRGTLYFGQKWDRTETQPSVRVDVEANEQQLFLNKPIVSPFAWNKCGLVVPVYPGMKALLSHNVGLGDDALLTGFLWSETPSIEPPQNKAGDWWLCLPIDFNPANAPPDDNTNAVNDLTANNGKRVVEVKGLKITVRSDKLSKVGQRPTEGADDEFVIEHRKALIKIAADGAIEILADAQNGKGKIAIASSGDIEMTANASGGVKLKLGASAVEIGP